MLDLSQYKLILDVWEGSLDINEEQLAEGGVDGLIVRLNSTAGTLHMDDNFTRQWEEGKRFARALYYVESPSYPERDQIKFLADHIPDDCQVVCPDLELRGSYGYLIPDINITLREIMHKKVMVYSGSWVQEFISLPLGEEYWWAAYPDLVYPHNSLTLTWPTLKQYLSRLSWIGNLAPGKIVLWQCSGDRLILPGTAGRAIDINLMPIADFVRIFGKPKPEPEPDPLPFKLYFPEITNGADPATMPPGPAAVRLTDDPR